MVLIQALFVVASSLLGFSSCGFFMMNQLRSRQVLKPYSNTVDALVISEVSITAPPVPPCKSVPRELCVNVPHVTFQCLDC